MDPCSLHSAKIHVSLNLKFKQVSFLELTELFSLYKYLDLELDIDLDLDLDFELELDPDLDLFLNLKMIYTLGYLSC